MINDVQCGNLEEMVGTAPHNMLYQIYLDIQFSGHQLIFQNLTQKKGKMGTRKLKIKIISLAGNIKLINYMLRKRESFLIKN